MRGLTSDQVNAIVRELIRVDGVKFGAEVKSSDSGSRVEVTAWFGPPGPDCVVWRSTVRLGDYDAEDPNGVIARIERSLKAFKSIINAAYEDGRKRGIESGKEEALKPFKDVAKAFAEAFK